MDIGIVELVFFGLLALIPLGFLVGLWRKAKGSSIDSWAHAHGITLTDETRAFVSTHLHRNLRWRTTGAVIGIVIPFGTNLPGLEMLIGYLLGALLAEVTASPFPATDGHRALLSPRGIDDYVSSQAVMRFQFLCVLATVTAAAFFILPLKNNVVCTLCLGETESPTTKASAITEMSAIPFAITALGALVLLGVVQASLRYIANRKQPAAAPDVMAADDALRSAGMHTTLGAGTAIAYLLLGAVVLGNGIATEWQILRWAAVPVSIACLLGSIVTWLRYGHDTPWAVQRPIPTLSA